MKKFALLLRLVACVLFSCFLCVFILSDVIVSVVIVVIVVVVFGYVERKRALGSLALFGAKSESFALFFSEFLR